MRTFRHDGIKNSRFNSVYDTSRVTKKKRLPRAVVWVLASAAALFLAIVFSRLGFLQVRQIVVSNTVTVDPAAIVAKADGVLSGNIFGVFPRRNIVFVPRTDIEEEILTEFPRVENVVVGRGSLSSINISVKEREPKYLWCNGNALDPRCYYMDDHGFIFDNAPTFSGTMYLEFAGGLYAADPLRKSPLSEGSISYILKTINFVENISDQSGAAVDSRFKISRVNLRDDGDIELVVADLDHHKREWKIIFSVTQDKDKLFEHIGVALSSIDKGKNAGKTSKDLSYIDMRFGRKVYYKFTDESL